MKRGVLLVAALAALTACGKKECPVAANANSGPPAQPGVVILPADSPKRKEIRVETIEAADVPRDEVDAPGKIEVNPNRVSHVVLPVAGRVTAVDVHVGDFVKQGQPVLTVESADIDAANSGFIQSQAAVSQARANLVKAQSDYDREKDLFEHDAVARKDVLSAENALAQAKSSLDQALAAEEGSRRRLQIYGLTPGRYGQRITVNAPISGKVLELSVVQGEFRNDTNAPVMTIADLSTVWVAADVPESKIRFIELGERVDLELAAYPGQVFHARVMRLGDTVDPQTRTIKVQAELENSGGRLRPEMYGRMHQIDSVVHVPVIPSGAIIQGDGQNAVWVERSPGKFEQVAVTLGNKAGDKVGVLSGLKAGDRVVVDGAMLLKGI